MTADSLKAPGATLHYDVRGSGPVLLLIPGAPADAEMYAATSGPLAKTYTVVSYDARGTSRSRLDGSPEDQRIEVHGDDAYRVLAAVGTEPAYVLGCGTGALAGLDLAAHHPGHIRALVAHEPPAVALLSDSARYQALFQEVYDTYRSDGVGPAMRRFDEGLGLPGGPPEDSRLSGRIAANAEFFVAHLLRAISGYAPDFAALRGAGSRIVVAAGEAATGQLAYRGAVATAARLGTKIVHFPGGHAGFATHPDAFAETLHQVLRRG